MIQILRWKQSEKHAYGACGYYSARLPAKSISLFQGTFRNTSKLLSKSNKLLINYTNLKPVFSSETCLETTKPLLPRPSPGWTLLGF